MTLFPLLLRIVKQRLHGHTSVSEFIKDAVDSSFRIDNRFK